MEHTFRFSNNQVNCLIRAVQYGHNIDFYQVSDCDEYLIGQVDIKDNKHVVPYEACTEFSIYELIKYWTAYIASDKYGNTPTQKFEENAIEAYYDSLINKHQALRDMEDIDKHFSRHLDMHRYNKLVHVLKATGLKAADYLHYEQ